MTKSAQDFCERAAELMRERGKQYDKPEGERSMARTVAAFNEVTGRDLSESEGWLLMLLLKQVRQWQQPGKYHADSAEDAVAYSALMAEALAAQEKANSTTFVPGEIHIQSRPTLPLLPIVVGGVYRTREGKEVSVVKDDDSRVPLKTSDGFWRFRDGQVVGLIPDPLSSTHRTDLVERIA